VTGTAIDTSAHPNWLRTGYKFFPYAAKQSGHWWVLRLNTGFPEHDLYTLFVDGAASVDITGPGDTPLAASVAALTPADQTGDAQLDPEIAAAVVQAVAPYVNYGSEHDDECLFCSGDDDPMTRA
jgi:hypothetical protein